MILMTGQNVCKCPGIFRWRNTEPYVVVCSCSVSMCWFRRLKRCSIVYQMWGAAFPQMLTCTTSPHSALLVSRLLIFPLFVWLSFFLCLFLSLSVSSHLSLFFSPLSCSLSGKPSWSSGEGIHVPVLRTSVGPCRAPALPPVPVLPAWMSSYSAA